MSDSPIFLILDGNALLHRTWHALPPLTTKDGVVVHAVYGFAMIVEKMLERYQPDAMAVAWDLPGKTFRHEKVASYKATREKKEQELYDQIPMIQNLLTAFHIPSLEAPGYEADDILGTLSAQAEQAGYQILLVTGDLDALQLVSKKTHVVFFQKGISETKLYNEHAVEERYGFTPIQLIDYKALRGDTSDNIAGIAGIGEKTATSLVQAYGSIAGIFQALNNGKIEEKIAKKLRGQEEAVAQALELVTIVRDVDLNFDFSSATRQEPDWEAILALYRQMDFRTLLRKHERLSGNTVISKQNVFLQEKTQKQQKQIVITRDIDVLTTHLTRLSTQEKMGVIIVDQQPDLFGATMAAVALGDHQFVVVISHPEEKHLKVIEQFLVELNKEVLIVTHDLKTLCHHHDWFAQYASSGSVHFFDTMLASYVVNSSQHSHDLITVANTQLHLKLHELPTAYLSQKEYEYLGEVISLLPSIAETLMDALKKTQVVSVYEEIELPLVPVLYRMEQQGVLLDSDALAVFSKRLKKQIEQLEKHIRSFAGEEVNVQSPIQLAEVLFVKLGLPTKGIKKTKTGYSTAASELEKLYDQHEIIPLISEFRELAKLQSTYVETLPKLVDTNGRLHTTFNQTVTSTGRLSSSDPNLQNIPIKTELGREIRRAFVAPANKLLISADYSQIQLRLAAVIAKDQPFIDAFQTGADIHTRTASEVWDVSEHDVTKEQRRAAKAINFGILYGMGSRALSRSTNLSLIEAKLFIEKYFEIHHAIRDYLDHTKQSAHEQRFVETLFGRKRYFPEIESGVPMLVAQAERMAINMPIQGTEADLMKKAMLVVDDWLRQTQLPAILLLQVHDELVFEVADDAVEVVARGVKKLMEGVAHFDVPLIVDVEIGKNWGDMKSM